MKKYTKTTLGPYELVRSPGYNYIYNKNTGYTEMWGNTRKEDPIYSPIGAQILDLEITTSCTGPRNKLCKFCSPKGTTISTIDGEKDISEIKVDDKVISFDSFKGKTVNNVKEVYEREIEEEIIVIETENDKLRLTSNHKIFTSRGWIEAGNLLETDFIMDKNDTKTQCKVCNNFIKYKGSYKRYYCSKDCYDKTHKEVECPICKNIHKPNKQKQIFCKDCLSRMYENVTLPHKHRLFKTYNSMIMRCYNKNRNNYYHYGGRGIKVNSSWLSFYSFIKDMDKTYNPCLTLERIDNDGDYCLNNCKWADSEEQRRNRRRFSSSKRKYKNICKYGDKWKVAFKHNNKQIYLGVYYDIKEAINVYNTKIKELLPTEYEKRKLVYQNEN